MNKLNSIKRVTLLLFWGMLFTAAVGAQEIPTLSLPEDFVRLGAISPRHAKDIKGSNWSVGAETMDRDYTLYKYWRAFLGPLGVKSARLQSGWAKTEQTKGVYEWAWLDEIIPDMIAQGVKPWVCFSFGNPIYADGGDGSPASKLPASSDALAAWDDFVREFVQRYGKHVNEWEIWNEPQHNSSITLPDYAEFFIRTAEIIRSEQPGAKLFAISSAGISIEKTKPFLEILKRKDKLALVNAVTFHPYKPNPDSSYQEVEKVRTMINAFSSNISLFQGENGAPSTERTYGALSGLAWTELSQAKWLLRRLLGDLGHDLRSSYFSIIDMHYVHDGKLRMNTKGLIATNPDKTVNRPKLSYRTYQNITAVFDNTLHRRPDVKAPGKPDDLVMFAYETTPTKEHAAKSVVCAWRAAAQPANDLRAPPCTLTLPSTGLEEPVFVDMLSGNVYGIGDKHISHRQGKIILEDIPIGDWPILIADRQAFGWSREPDLEVKTMDVSNTEYERIRQCFVQYVLSKKVKPDARMSLSFPSLQDVVKALDKDGKWPEIDYDGKVPGTWQPQEHLKRALRLAQAVYDPDGPWHGNEEMRAALHRALGYYVRERPVSPNWYHNNIFSPRTLGWIMFLMGDDATEAEIEGTLHYMKNCGFGTHTGSNRAAMATCTMMRGVLTRNLKDLIIGRDVLAEGIVCTTNEGFQADWSYHLHGPQQQFGNYGMGHAEEVMPWMRALSGTPLAFSEEKTMLMHHFLVDGLSRTVWKGRMDTSASGRQLFAGTSQQKAERVRDLLNAMIDVKPGRADEYRLLVKALETEVAPSNQRTGNCHFWRSDYMIDRRPTYCASVKMSSERVIPTEVINRENLHGSHLGDGVLYLYRTGREYEDIYPIWDWRKLPGITTVLKMSTYTRSTSFNNCPFVGGVSDGMDGLAAMDYFRNLASTGKHDKGSLSYRKSWFFFRGHIVALGADIAVDLAPERKRYFKLTTSLNQVHLNGPVMVPGDNGKPIELAEQKQFKRMDWAWHDDTGYFLLEPAAVTVGGREQSGKWSDIFWGGNEETITGDVFSIWIDHTFPTDEKQTFAYLIVPGIGAAEMPVKQTRPGVDILSNTGQLQAVRHGNLTMASFFEAGSLTVADKELKVHQPCLIMARQDSDSVEWTVADPTHQLKDLTLGWGGVTVSIPLPRGGLAGRSVTLPANAFAHSTAAELLRTEDRRGTFTASPTGAQTGSSDLTTVSAGSAKSPSVSSRAAPSREHSYTPLEWRTAFRKTGVLDHLRSKLH